MDKYAQKALKSCDFTLSNGEIEELLVKNKYNHTKYSICNGKVSFSVHGTVKNRRRNILTYLLKKVVSIEKYSELNIEFFVNTDDWGSRDDVKDLPILMYSAHEDSKNILIPDYLFLHNYQIYSGRNKNGLSANVLLKRLNGSVKYENKLDKCFFRAGTSKNRDIIKMFSKDTCEHVDAEWSHKDFMSYEDMFKHKFVISHYMKWDSVYFFLKSDLLMFNYTGFQYRLWYDLFVEDDVDYVSFQSRDEFDSKFKKLVNNPTKCKDIIQHSTEIADTWFTYDNAIEYMGELLLELSKKTN